MKIYSLKRKIRIHEILGGKCNQCGSVNNLEVDHRDRTKKSLTFGKRWHQKWANSLIEIKKCQLLCKNCHQKKSILESGKKIAKGTHGTLSSYKYCKCDLCKQAKADYMKNYTRMRNSVARVLRS